MVAVATSEIPGEGNTGGGGGGGGSGGGGAAPPYNTVRWFDLDHRHMNPDIEIRWNYIDKRVKTGKITLDAKIGDTDVALATVVHAYNLDDNMSYYSQGFLIRKQLTENSYEELEIMGLQFTNWVYEGKTIVINAGSAFAGEEEGFLVPLNQEVLRDMSIKDVTQISYDCSHMVFNCYQVVKKKWYQSGWFKILLIIIAIIITVFTWGADGGASLSAALAYGAAAAIVGVSALTVWLAATFLVLASMVLMSLLTPVITDVFGEKWGPVIAVVVSVVAMNWGQISGIASGTVQVTSQTLIQASIATINAYGAYLQGQLASMDIPGQMAALKSEYEARMEEIEKLTKEMLGTNTDIIDIQGMTKAAEFMYESPSTFLTRTLMTGSDVAAITEGLVSNFTEVGLQLPTTS